MTLPGQLAVDKARLLADLETLAGFSADSPDGGVTRRAWSKEYVAAQEWLTGRMEGAGLTVAVDAVGNVWGRWEAGDLPAVVTGSHVDSVPSGGMFDGCLGVLGAVEVVRALRAGGHRPRRQIWVVAWMEEEGSAFGSALLGSRAFVGELDLDAAASLENADGVTLRSAVEAAGHAWDELALLPAGLADVGAYLELHIEQGPLLEHRGIPIGVVTDIVGIECGRVTFTGRANHAGGTPMDLRQDAVVGAARALLVVRDLAVERGVRVTTGQLDVRPGATNVIPGNAEFSIDARHPDAAVLATYMADLQVRWREVAEAEGLGVRYARTYSLPPVPMDGGLQDRLRQACAALSLKSLNMVSGAGHDAMVLARHVPTAMLFVPSRAGVSHAREEFTTPTDCARGAQVLAYALAGLTGEDRP